VFGHCVGPGEGLAAAWGVSGVLARRASHPFGEGDHRYQRGIRETAATAMQEGN
jgi:hypothetical protein